MCLVLSGSVDHFDVALLWTFINHDYFTLIIQYSSLLLLLFCFRFYKDTRKPGSSTPHQSDFPRGERQVF